MDNMTKMPWGKHKGLIIKFVPTTYLQWLRDNIEHSFELVETVEEELIRRRDEDDHTWDD